MVWPDSETSASNKIVPQENETAELLNAYVPRDSLGWSADRATELLSEVDENSFVTPDVAEPVDVFIIHDFIDLVLDKATTSLPQLTFTLLCRKWCALKVLNLDGDAFHYRCRKTTIAIGWVCSDCFNVRGAQEGSISNLQTAGHP